MCRCGAACASSPTAEAVHARSSNFGGEPVSCQQHRVGRRTALSSPLTTHGYQDRDTVGAVVN
ncbi:hypothetical protein I547_7106 [Mycobacterium kansasii 824]|nr:hypothetical protein I547_7106 [Mycobacterium kansasii 824]KEP41431.1 hypothetical protein MKSMC1_34470 [Mycobacterium kansasii]